jgi:D-lactate dehydrogenase (cytochrome)
VVVHPKSTEDVAKIVKIAIKYKMPVTPYSGGSSLEGNFRAVRLTLPLLVLCKLASYMQHSAGGMCVDMSGMDKILEIHGMTLEVGSGLHADHPGQRRIQTSSVKQEFDGWM